MALPATIRVNVRAPFPALVTGSGLITVTKANGIWTIGFNPALIAVQNPPANPLTDLALVWDPTAKMMVLLPLQTVQAGARPQRAIIVAGDLPIRNTDSILNMNPVTDLAPPVPLASTRNGASLTFNNLPGSHLQTLTRTAPDTFDGFNTLGLAGGTEITLRPYNDGINAGYKVE
jgi:hypothetical protein